MITQATPDSITRAADLLRQGELVAFPTETVFGLGANALSDQAVTRLYGIKQRPADKALAVMVHSAEQAGTIAVLDKRARNLMEHFWPGPLSLVVPQKPDNGISPIAMAGGTATISLRMPSHPVALALLKLADIPVAAPSANPSGSLSTSRAADVHHAFGDSIAMVLADTTKVIGIESTILDLTVTPAKILRTGAVPRDEIERVIGAVDCVTDADRPYTLKTPLRLNAVDVKAGEAFLGFGSLNFIGAEGVGFVRDMPEHMWRNLSAEGDLDQAAANLYRMLSELDTCGASCIAVMTLPETGLGMTINDRLRRCAQVTK